jgi:putative sigma-54 modulation protein
MMQINVSGHHINVTPPLRRYVSEKLERIQRHSDHVVNANCILTVEKLQHKAEAMISMRGIQIYADAIDQDMYAAIDGLADKLDRQVRKHKEKNSDHHARDVDKSVYE